jgi:hypothetical protein
LIVLKRRRTHPSPPGRPSVDPRPVGGRARGPVGGKGGAVAAGGAVAEGCQPAYGIVGAL